MTGNRMPGERAGDASSGSRLSIVGIGPGGREQMTLDAVKAVSEADHVVGYSAYVELLGDLLTHKQTVSTGMGKEVDRVKLALDLLDEGSVALISSGDPNIYGMAGLGMEMASRQGALGKVDVVPGVTSFTAAACKAGVTFRRAVAVLSLSDLLTPWSSIQRRATVAAMMGLPLALYNPRSKRRDWQLRKVLEIWSNLWGDADVLVARNVSREGESFAWTTVAGLLEREEEIGSVDMFSLVIISGWGMNRGEASRESFVNMVGIGPGGEGQMTSKARDILGRSSLVLGPPRYLDQVKGMFPGEAVYHRGELQTRVKARMAAARAASEMGKTSSILVGGDPSIFSSTWRFLAEAGSMSCPVCTSPGVSAFSAVAARAGAPLVNDFVLLSGIPPHPKGGPKGNVTSSRGYEKALEEGGNGSWLVEAGVPGLIEAGFGVVIYNLNAGKLAQVIQEVPEDHPCALARDLGRTGTRKIESLQVSEACELDPLKASGVKRFTLILAGAGSCIRDGRIIVRRGYETKYEY